MKRYLAALAVRLGTIPEPAFAGITQDRAHRNSRSHDDNMANAPVIRRDTGAWRLQVWVSFAISVMLCGSGLAWLPGADLDRAFMVMGYVFCLSTAFALAKFIRDNQDRQVDTPMWRLVVWSGFALAMGLTGWGLWRMEIQPVWKAYLGVCWLYLISNVFTLAKMLRDAHEADLFEARLQGRREAMAASAEAQ
ncbi:YiaA/YiaB family inner membrane protein [Roseateles saccharophilus]|uniref:YiaAB two helix domain-containing protein n=2 Tax=Roseateles saccharophilus TaxID=304 RepID=A0A4R3VBX6_ROSSA|nr:hypothetical protein EV671_1007178 [Roseateles saccharophilus]